MPVTKVRPLIAPFANIVVETAGLKWPPLLKVVQSDKIATVAVL